jgi:hypothetical protein
MNALKRFRPKNLPSNLTENVVTDYRASRGSGAGSMFGISSYDGQHLWRFYLDLDAMLIHPSIFLPLAFVKSPVTVGEIKVESDNPAVVEFAHRQWNRFKNNAITRILDSGYAYGWAGSEVVYDVVDGMLHYDHMNFFHSRDVRPLTLNDQIVGISVVNAGQNGAQLYSANENIPNKGFWYAHNRPAGRHFGRSQLLSAHKYWKRLAGVDGAEEMTDLGAYKYAVGFTEIRFPEEKIKIKRNGETVQVEARDLAREMGENLKAGANIQLPSTSDENGKEKWAINFQTPGLSISDLLAREDDLRKQIKMGLGVPPELMEAAETGSGFSGRLIPMMAFLMAQQTPLNDLVDAFDRFILRPLIRANFGPDTVYSVVANDLQDTFRQMFAKDPMGTNGGQQQGQQQPQPAQAGQPDPMQMGEGDDAEGMPPEADLQGITGAQQAKPNQNDAILAAMLEAQHEATERGEPDAAKDEIEALGKLKGANFSALLGWTPAKSQRGGTKAIGTGNDSGRVLYGKQAEAALRGKQTDGVHESHRDRQATRNASAAKAKAVVDKVYNLEEINDQDIADFTEHAPSLTLAELKQARAYMAAKLGGAKKHADIVAKLREHVAKHNDLIKGRVAEHDAVMNAPPEEATRQKQNVVPKEAVEPQPVQEQPQEQPQQPAEPPKEEVTPAPEVKPSGFDWSAIKGHDDYNQNVPSMTGQIAVSGYNANAIPELKAIGATFDPKNKQWNVPANAIEQAKSIAKKHGLKTHNIVSAGDWQRREFVTRVNADNANDPERQKALLSIVDRLDNDDWNNLNATQLHDLLTRGGGVWGNAHKPTVEKLLSTGLLPEKAIAKLLKLHPEFAEKYGAKPQEVSAPIPPTDTPTEPTPTHTGTVSDSGTGASGNAATEGLATHRPDATVEQTSEGKGEEKKEIVGSGNMGEVVRDGDYVFKNTTRPDGTKSKEGEIYEALKGVPGVAEGQQEGDKVKVKHYQEVLSTDTVPNERDRKSMGHVVGKQDNIKRLLLAVNALSDLNMAYNDPLQVGFDDNWQAHVLDFSNAGEIDSANARMDNMTRLTTFLRDFGAEGAADHIEDTMGAYNYLYFKSHKTPEELKKLAAQLVSDPKKKRFQHLAPILDKLSGKNIQYAYYTRNPRPIDTTGRDILQSELDENGLRMVFSEQPLDDDTIRQYNLMPVKHSVKPASTPVGTAQNNSDGSAPVKDAPIEKPKPTPTNAGTISDSGAGASGDAAAAGSGPNTPSMFNEVSSTSETAASPVSPSAPEAQTPQASPSPPATPNASTADSSKPKAAKPKTTKPKTTKPKTTPEPERYASPLSNAHSREEKLKVLKDYIAQEEGITSGPRTLTQESFTRPDIPLPISEGELSDLGQRIKDKIASSSFGTPTTQLYEQFGQPLGLSKHDFMRALWKLKQQGSLRLSQWSGMPDDIPDPDLVIPHSSKLMAYVHAD